jgi:hypothetical protein
MFTIELLHSHSRSYVDDDTNLRCAVDRFPLSDTIRKFTSKKRDTSIDQTLTTKLFLRAHMHLVSSSSAITSPSLVLHLSFSDSETLANISMSPNMNMHFKQ